MNRTLTRWFCFGLGLLVLGGALSWVTVRTLSLEAEQALATEQARMREQVRLALWRMEAVASSVVVRESARPTRHYQTFPEVEALVGGEAMDPEAVEIRQPSPLLGTTPDLVKLHFQCEPLTVPGARSMYSPQVPQGRERELALEKFEVSPEIEEAERRMAEMKGLLASHREWEAIAGFQLMAVSGKTGTMFVRREDGTGTTVAAVHPWGTPDQIWRDASLVRDPIEQSVIASKAPAMKGAVVSPAASTRPEPEEVVGDMKILWLGDELVLVRRVMQANRLRMQGAWLDWPELEGRLLASISDLLPEAHLDPIRPGETRDDWRALVTLPIRLEPGLLPAATEAAPRFGVKPALALAWLCLLGSSGAVGLVLHRTMQLSERRAAFVSAVTHELRTPLTTFRVYSEMLAEGAVTEEERRKEYLRTLCDESDRLTRLVENVLAFSRIERTSAPPRMEPIELDGLIGNVLPRLEDRCRQVGLRLEVNRADVPPGSSVTTDALVVEQVLFNLVDNAAKYAAEDSDPPEVHLDVDSDRGRWRFTVRDFGPGLSPSARRKLFEPFCKSAHEAAHSAPGVGLGLALCRRLARQLGGDLEHVDPEGRGASFVFTLPGA